MNEEIKSIPLLEAYTFAKSKGLTDIAEIRGMEIEWDKSYNSSVRKGFIIRLLKDHNILDEFIEKHWPTGKTPVGEKKNSKGAWSGSEVRRIFGWRPS